MLKVQSVKAYFTSHLDEMNLTYMQHMAHALRICCYCFAAACCLLLHAILPFICKTKGSQLVHTASYFLKQKSNESIECHIHLQTQK